MISERRYCFLELAKKLGSICDEEMQVLMAWSVVVLSTVCSMV